MAAEEVKALQSGEHGQVRSLKNDHFLLKSADLMLKMTILNV